METEEQKQRHRDRSRAWAAKNRARKNETARAWRARSPMAKVHSRRNVAANREANNKRRRDWWGKKTPEEKLACSRSKPKVTAEQKARKLEWQRQSRRTTAKLGYSPKRKSKHYNDKLYEAASKALKSVLDRSIREEIIAEVVMACLEGKMLLREIAPATARKFITDYWRFRDQFKTVSLDAPVPGLDGVTFLDMLADQSA